jgi:hypothetical protein
MDVDELLTRSSRSVFATYHPGHVIDAVNELVPRGTAGAIAALDAFIGRHDLSENPLHGIFLVLRVLFDADPHPPVRLGGSRPPPPRDPTALPRFPITIVEDVPLMLVASYTIRGVPELVTAHLDYYRLHGTVRPTPLTPNREPDRMEIYLDRYAAAYQAPPSPAEVEFVQAQLDRLNL